MTQSFKNYIYNQSQVSSLLIDAQNTDYIWVAFEKDTNNITKLFKNSAHNPLQKFYDITVPVNRINRMTQDSNNIYLSVEDSINLGYKYSKSNPLTSILPITIPIGVVEYPIDIAVSDDDIYFLTPGNISGEIAKIIRTDKNGNLLEVFELQQSGDTILNASGMTIDDDDNLWVVTNTSPVTLVRVFLDGFSNLTMQTHQII